MLSSLQVTRDSADPMSAMYIKPTGAPRALVIERDISAAAGKMHVVRGPLVPASLVRTQWSVNVQTTGFVYQASGRAVTMSAYDRSFSGIGIWESMQLWF